MTPFIIFTTQRSGSTVLTRTLDEHPQVFCAGELFHEINDIHHPEWHFPSWGFSENNRKLRKLDKIINYPNVRLRAVPHLKRFFQPADDEKTARGFKLMISQIRSMPHVWQYLKANDTKVIVLIRKNIFRTGLSRLRKDVTRIPHMEKKDSENLQIHIDPKRLLHHMRFLERVNQELITRSEGMDRIVIYYEDFGQWEQLMEKLYRFLEVEAVSLQPVLNKIGAKDWRQEVSNHEEIERLLTKNNYSQYL